MGELSQQGKCLAGVQWSAGEFLTWVLPVCVCPAAHAPLPPPQGHGSHRHLLGGAPEQNPEQSAGNAVPNATDARPNGSRLRARRRETDDGRARLFFKRIRH